MIPSRKYLFRILADIRLALIYGTIWWPLLWLSGHPLEEWAMTAVVLYISLWLSRELIVNLVLFASKLLTDYGRRIANKAGIEISHDRIEQFSTRENLLFVSLVLLLFAAVVGASLSVAMPALVWLGLTPLAAYFIWLGWAFLGLGATGLALIFAVLWLVLVTLDDLVDNLNEKSAKEISGFGVITEKVASYAGML